MKRFTIRKTDQLINGLLDDYPELTIGELKKGIPKPLDRTTSYKKAIIKAEKKLKQNDR